MKFALDRLMFWWGALALAVTLLALPAAAQTNLTPGEELDELEEDLGYGYNTRDGSAVLEAQNSATFCADAAIVVVDPGDAAEVQKTLNAKDRGDGSWEVPAPDTNEIVVAKVQNATAFYDSGAPAPAGIDSSLPVLSRAAISIVRPIWTRCWRVKRYHLCGVVGNCKTGCFFGYRFVNNVNHLVCRYTGNPFDRCLEFLYPACRLNKYTCRDCTGPIVASWLWRKWVCAVF